MNKDQMGRAAFVRDMLSKLERAYEVEGVDTNQLPSVKRAAVSTAVSMAERRRSM